MSPSDTHYGRSDMHPVLTGCSTSCARPSPLGVRDFREDLATDRAVMLIPDHGHTVVDPDEQTVIGARGPSRTRP